MLKRYWIFVAALGIALIFSGLAQSQEQAQTTGQATGNSQEPAEPAFVWMPVPVVQDEAEAQARESREAEARQREIDDLAAQQGMHAAAQEMNAVTQRMADYAYWQTWFIGLGTALLVGTLYMTAQANKSAQDGATAALAAVEADRPWCAISGVDTLHFMDSTIADVKVHRTVGISVNWRNFGRSPALHAKLMRSFQLVGETDPVPHFDFEFTDEVPSTILPPGGDIRCPQIGPLSVPQYSALIEGSAVLYIFSAMEYTMVGGAKKFVTTSCLRMDVHGMTPENNIMARYVAIGPQNDAT